MFKWIRISTSPLYPNTDSNIRVHPEMMLLDQANSMKQENHQQILSLDLIIQHHSSHLLILLSTLTMAQLNILTLNQEFRRIQNNDCQDKDQARVLQQLRMSIKPRVVESNLCHI
uniref:Uncharacterized protein n=1 Tax=Meloidogyne incognita TaxID=6306 RepID=A0A914LW76_MELIC